MGIDGVTPGSCNVSIRYEPIYNVGKVRIGIKNVWHVSGWLMSQIGPADLDSQINLMMAAFSVNGLDLVLFMPDGQTPSQQALYNVNTLGGTRVTLAPTFPTGKGAEYVTYRSFEFEVEAEVPDVGSLLSLASFQETLDFYGGGPIIGWLEPAVGSPQQQTFKEQTVFGCNQDGKIVGYQSYPVPPAPIWPGYLLKAPRFKPETPERIGDAYKNYPVSYHYEFASDAPLIGIPNLWPI